MKLQTLRLVALDIDGPCLKDTFSPVIRMLVERWGGVYTAEVENAVFSQNRDRAAGFLIRQFGLDMKPDELLTLYFREREKFEAEHETGPVEGLEGFLDLVDDLGLSLLCYGGLNEDYFRKNLGPLASRFERYVCTNDFRPGVKEIVRDITGREFREALFVDDVSGVARAAKEFGASFVGIPSSFSWGHQREEMVRAGVRYIFDSVADIDEETFLRLDAEASLGTHWGESGRA